MAAFSSDWLRARVWKIVIGTSDISRVGLKPPGRHGSRNILVVVLGVVLGEEVVG